MGRERHLQQKLPPRVTLLSVILTLVTLRQEDYKFKDSPSCIVANWQSWLQVAAGGDAGTLVMTAGTPEA